jgi:hypothetical protein
VTPEMAYNVANTLKSIPGVRVLVAPYEADAQLAFLSRNNIVDFVISEDSDLLVYKCRRVLYKLDFKSERGREIVYDHIFSCSDFARLSPLSFVIACTLSGCDYIDSVASIGIKTAINIAAKLEGFIERRLGNTSTSGTVTKLCRGSLSPIVDRIGTLLKLSGVDVDLVSEKFLSSLADAILTFHYQTVFDPSRLVLVPLMAESEDTVGDCHFLGPLFPNTDAIRVANCEIHPDTKKVFADYVETKQVATNQTRKRPRHPTQPLRKAVKRTVSSPPLQERGPTRLIDFWNKKCLKNFADPFQEVIDLDKEAVDNGNIDSDNTLKSSEGRSFVGIDNGQSRSLDELEKFVFK